MRGRTPRFCRTPANLETVTVPSFGIELSIPMAPCPRPARSRGRSIVATAREGA